MREVHTSILIPSEEGGMKEERDTDNNIIIIDSTLHEILSPQLINMTSRYKLMCGCEHRWELPVLYYHKIMVIYPYPFFVVITQ